MPDRENDTRSTDAAGEPTRTADHSFSSVSSGPSASSATSRRDVLGRTATAIAGGALLTGVAGRARATPHGEADRPLDVRTTDVEVLDESGGETAGEAGAETTGTVEGMERVDAEKCRIGAQVCRADHEKWYGGVHDVVTVRASVRVAVTLSGLRSGTYDCRLVACPVTHDHVCFGNRKRIDVKGEGASDERKHRSGDEEDEKEEEDEEKKDGHGGRSEEKRHEEDDDCPCELHHPGKRHLTFHADDWRVVRRYAFAVSTRRVERSSRNCVPDLDEYFAASSGVSARDNVVTGALAGGADSFLLSGEVADLRCDDGVEVYLDGESI